VEVCDVTEEIQFGSQQNKAAFELDQSQDGAERRKCFKYVFHQPHLKNLFCRIPLTSVGMELHVSGLVVSCQLQITKSC